VHGKEREEGGGGGSGFGLVLPWHSRAATAKAPKKRRSESYKLYIHKVLKMVHPNQGISKNAMEIMEVGINGAIGLLGPFSYHFSISLLASLD
jgi:hypothetical protein